MSNKQKSCRTSGIEEVGHSSVRCYIQASWEASVRRPGGTPPGVIDLSWPYGSPTVSETFSLLCYWDTYFTALGLWADGRDALAEGMADNLIWLIEKHGYVPRYVLEGDLTRSQIPVASTLFRERHLRRPSNCWLARAGAR